MATQADDLDVSTEVLRWARTNAGLALDEAAKKSSVTEEDLSAWEQKTQLPSFADLKKLADAYKTPLAVFFLSEPPTSDARPKDYRTFDSKDHKGLSFKTVLMLRKARLAQDIASDLYASLGVDYKFKLKKYTLDADPEKLAVEIRQKLGLSFDKQRKIKDHAAFFDYLRREMENLGVIIQKSAQHNSFPLEDARAISLVDKEPYVIIINNKDIDSAKVFSLAHEFGHVLLRHAGICNDFDYYVGDRQNEVRKMESFCNQFAANFLVPEKDFLEHPLLIGMSQVDDDQLDDVLETLYKEFKVSKSVILRRLLTYRFISKDAYEQKIEDWKRSNHSPKAGGGRNSPARTAIAVNGPTFTSLTVEAYKRQKISYANVSEYLGIKTKYIPALEKLLRKL